jgi:L-alanine-DL-glutamate epimerase-like enolase superfamily enzyme
MHSTPTSTSCQANTRTDVRIHHAEAETYADLRYFSTMVDAEAVDGLQVGRHLCGGYGGVAARAAVAAGHNLEVSGHCPPNLTEHVASATANLRHLEYFHDHERIELLVFDGALPPPADHCDPTSTSRAGHGLSLRHHTAEPYRPPEKRLLAWS